MIHSLILFNIVTTQLNSVSEHYPAILYTYIDIEDIQCFVVRFGIYFTSTTGLFFFHESKVYISNNKALNLFLILTFSLLLKYVYFKSRNTQHDVTISSYFHSVEISFLFNGKIIAFRCWKCNKLGFNFFSW